MEFDTSGLRHAEVQFAESTLDGLDLESVGVAASVRDPLVRSGSKSFASFQLHRFIHEDIDRLSHSVESVLGQEFDDVIESC